MLPLLYTMEKGLRLISTISKKMKFIGMNGRIFREKYIGANLTDGMFRGVYNNDQKHQRDLDAVLERSWHHGLEKIIITVGTINDLPEAVKIAQNDERIYFTMGCHPTRCGEFGADPTAYYEMLCDALQKHREKIVAIGECGLDYDRLNFCDKATQKTYFERQIDLVQQFKLPMFLHCRNAFDDFYEILTRNASKITNGGVVHSFDGTIDQAMKFIDLGFHIGLNGCSLKTEKQLEVVAQIPNGSILLETDCPWCGIRPSHAGSKHVKTTFPINKRKEKWTADTLIDRRYEPAQIIQVLEVISGVKNENIEELAAQYRESTLKLFFDKRST